MANALTNRVLLIGWDAADWKVIHPLMEAGKMPHLKRLVESGASGNLASLDPPMSPIMWTSIGTGKTADKHGVLGFTQPRADGAGVQPVLASSRKVKAVWNILMQQGLKTHVIGWWPSHPAERLNGVSVSNFYHHVSGSVNKPTPMPAGSVHPPRVAQILDELRIHPQELTGNHIAPFVPNADCIDQDKDKRLSSVAKITAECATVHAAATWVMENEEWDFMAVYYDAIDHYCHGFMRFHPPHREGIPQELYDNYKGVVEGGYRLHDMMLGRLLELAGPDTTVIICSDHGFHPDHLRPMALSREPAAPAEEHRHYGMIAMNGPGVQRDRLIFGASLLDITPTILALYGLPIGRDMDGKPLLDALATQQAPELIDSWEQVAGDSGMRAPEEQHDPWAEQEAMEQLVALGYIDPPDKNAGRAIASCQRETRYYLARVYLHKGDYESALPLLQALYDEQPHEMRFGVRLANCHQLLGDIAAARRIVDATIQGWEERAWTSHCRRLEKLTEQGRDVPPELSALTLDDLRRNNRPALDLLQGSLLLAEDKPDEALFHLQRANEATPSRPDLHRQLGDAYLRMRRYQDAEAAYFRALEIDPDNAQALHGLARVYLKMRHFREAAEAAGASLGLLFHNPQAHYHLGVARFRLGDFFGAETAWRNAVVQAPGMRRAHERLGELYARYLNRPADAVHHQRLANGSPDPAEQEAPDTSAQSHAMARAATPATAPSTGRPGEAIVVVSGLPRSGTSMMMQMLQRGGIEPLTDEVRAADEHNRNGYYEFEPVKALLKSADTTWLNRAGGRAVKVIAQLLPSLPADHHYRVIFMQRDMQEVLQSQAVMLHDTRKPTAAAHLAEAYTAQLRRVEQQMNAAENMEVLYLQHRDVMEQPELAAAAVGRFLGLPFDAARAATAIDPTLYRTRTKTQHRTHYRQEPTP